MSLENICYLLAFVNCFFAGYLFGSQRRQPALQDASVPTLQGIGTQQPMWTISTTTSPVPKPKRKRKAKTKERLPRARLKRGDPPVHPDDCGCGECEGRYA